MGSVGSKRILDYIEGLYLKRELVEGGS